MAHINYNVNVPSLDGMNEAQRNRAIEDYMRESNRQIRLILAELGRAADKAQQTADAAATPAQLSEAIAASEARLDDYITERGEIGEWTYEKYKSGAVEFWANSYTINLGTFNSWTSELIYASGSVTFPFTLRSEITTNVQLQIASKPNTTEVNGLDLIIIKSTTGFRLRFVRKASVTAVYADIRVRGYLATD